MRLSHIKEPRLEFAQGIHVCPRAGIASYEVYDTILEGRRDTILIGAVGTDEGITKLNHWLDICSKSIPGKKDAKQPNLFPAFCGFNKDSGFKTTMSLFDRNIRILNHTGVQTLLKLDDWNDRITSTVNLYLQEVAFLAQHRSVDVIICILPDDLYNLVSKEAKKPLEETIEDEDDPEEYLELNFRRALNIMTLEI